MHACMHACMHKCMITYMHAHVPTYMQYIRAYLPKHPDSITLLICVCVYCKHLLVCLISVCVCDVRVWTSWILDPGSWIPDPTSRISGPRYVFILCLSVFLSGAYQLICVYLILSSVYRCLSDPYLCESVLIWCLSILILFVWCLSVLFYAYIMFMCA